MLKRDTRLHRDYTTVSVPAVGVPYTSGRGLNDADARGETRVETQPTVQLRPNQTEHERRPRAALR